MAEVRNNWEGRTVNERFPLRRFLGSSNHSSVFLTESAVEGFLNAAIKLVPVEPERRQQQLWQWKTAATFAHPHLMRLLDSGQCELDGQAFLFVVMEYAEESLSQILPYRALGSDEVRELLVPTLDALAFLHRENWIQGQLKPSNFLVVNDQLKLAIDTIRPVGGSQVAPRRPSIYDPPESDDGNVSPASDIWALGVTMTEALTQYPPTWLGGRRDPATFPTNLPPEFADIIQRCLSPNPQERPTVAQLQVKTQPGAAAPAPQPTPAPVQARAPVPPLQQPPLQIAEPPPIRADVRTFSGFEEEPKRGVLVPALVAVVVVGLAIWGGTKLLSRPAAAPPATSLNPTPSAKGGDSQAAAPASPAAYSNTSPPSGMSAARPAANAEPARTEPTPTPPNTTARNTSPRRQSATGSGAVVHEEIPKVSASSRSTIRGHVRVAVRVVVDSSGRVVRDNLDNPSSSNYFNRVASEAARKWRFSPADQASREWLLHFEFGREGTTVHAAPRS